MLRESVRNGILGALHADPALPARFRHDSKDLGDAVMSGHSESIMEFKATLSCSASAGAGCGSPLVPASAATVEKKVVLASDCEGHCCSRGESPAGSTTSDVRENYEEALEHNPEAFGTVVMLYVDVKVNGTSTAAYVDTGAQTTVMSRAFARRCGIDHLIDTRCSGVAEGVGTTNIFGRVHLAFLELDDHLFAASFEYVASIRSLPYISHLRCHDNGQTRCDNSNVLTFSSIYYALRVPLHCLLLGSLTRQHCGYPIGSVIDIQFDILLGLDMLRKHEASIDLSSDCLLMGAAVARFLPEHKVRRHKRRQRRRRAEQQET